jgi:hypothetical protein
MVAKNWNFQCILLRLLVDALFLSSADYKVVAEGLGIIFAPSHPSPRTFLKVVTNRPPTTHLMTNEKWQWYMIFDPTRHPSPSGLYWNNIITIFDNFLQILTGFFFFFFFFLLFLTFWQLLDNFMTTFWQLFGNLLTIFWKILHYP